MDQQMSRQISRQIGQQVLVIGGGVIGLSSAWYLLEAGFRVTLLEREAVMASGASERNGGQLSYRYVAPLADAGVPWKAMHWLLQGDGPLRWRPRAELAQWRWLLQFLLKCNAASNARGTAMLLQLGERSRQALARLALAPADFCWRDPGKLVLYRSERLFEAAAAQPDPDQRRQLLTPAQALQLEPALAALAPQMAGAIFNAGEAVADCHAFCLALERRLRAHPNFTGVQRGNAQAFLTAQGKVTALDSSAGPLAADHYVLAAGIDSVALAASAGLRLPLYALKGYSLSAPISAGHQPPSISVTDFERKVLYARIGEQLRVAAMADLVGNDRGIDPARLASLHRLARAAMPQAADYDQAIAWAGLRPATPGGTPIIGATPYRNLWLNVGHGALGFTFACGSASLLAELMRGKEMPPALGGLGWRG